MPLATRWEFSIRACAFCQTSSFLKSGILQHCPKLGTRQHRLVAGGAFGSSSLVWARRLDRGASTGIHRTEAGSFKLRQLRSSELQALGMRSLCGVVRDSTWRYGENLA